MFRAPDLSERAFDHPEQRHESKDRTFENATPPSVNCAARNGCCHAMTALAEEDRAVQQRVYPPTGKAAGAARSSTTDSAR